MHKLRVIAVIALLVGGSALAALATEPVESAGDAAQGAGHAIKGAAEATGHAVKEGAEATGHYVKEGAQATGHAIESGAQATGDALGITGEGEEVSAAEAARYERAEKAEHRMIGTVGNIDRDKGRFDLLTKEATLKLNFPPSAVRSLKDGETATVELAYVKLPVKESETSQKAYDATEAAERGAHWRKGTVEHLNPQTGVFDLKSASGTTQVHFPPSKIANLGDGDQVAVKVAITQPMGSQNETRNHT
jgi:hypothetical protein